MSQRDAASQQAAPAPNQTAGLGSLLDADLTMEVARLTALRNRQALGEDSPSGVNRTPQTLLSLFSHA